MSKNSERKGPAPMSRALSARVAAFASKELQVEIPADVEFVYRSQFESQLPKIALDVIFGNESGLQTPDFREGLAAVRSRKNALKMSRRTEKKNEMGPWSDNILEEIPFVCDPFLSDDELKQRLAAAIYKHFPPRHYAGCGYSASLRSVHRKAAWKGYVEVAHYHGIGD